MLAVKNMMKALVIILTLCLWTFGVFNSGRLIGSAQTLSYQARLSESFFGISNKEFTTYLESARYIMYDSTYGPAQRIAQQYQQQ